VSSPSDPSSPDRTFRLPALTYGVVLFLAIGVIPLAFTADGDYQSKGVLGPQTALVIVPVLAAWFIARTATVVNPDGIRVRAMFGSTELPWTRLRGLSVQGRSVYAVADDGSVRLPCVRVNDLAAVAQASGGRLPELPAATVHAAPSRRRR
jgi:hypothetical protein